MSHTLVLDAALAIEDNDIGAPRVPVLAMPSQDANEMPGRVEMHPAEALP